MILFCPSSMFDCTLYIYLTDAQMVEYLRHPYFSILIGRSNDYHGNKWQHVQVSKIQKHQQADWGSSLSTAPQSANSPQCVVQVSSLEQTLQGVGNYYSFSETNVVNKYVHLFSVDDIPISIQLCGIIGRIV